MSENKNILLFLSCVSDEFHKPDPAGLRPFLSYREHLRQSFRKAGVEIIVQEELAQSFGDLLETIDKEVARCHVVVHLVGDMAGASPTVDEVRRLGERHPGLFAHEPTLGARLSEPLPISYTQWEVYLTFHHHGRPLVFLAKPDTVRSPCHRQEPTQLSSQARHRQTIEALGKHWEPFDNPDNLALKIFIALTREGVLTTGAPGAAAQQVLESARQAISTIVAAIGQRIKKPDPRAVHAAASSNVDVLSHAYHTVAQEHGLTPQALVQLLDERHAVAHAAAEAQRTPEALCDLALTQIALGDFEEAMRTATEAAQLAEKALRPAAPDAEQRRETALNAWLLVAEAARAARHPDQAIAAQERGGQLIDRDREPIFWAEYHEPLAELLLDIARYDDAERYIRDIIALREEHLGENHLKLAEALCVLGRLLFARANYLGVEVVAERILRILDGFPPEEAAGLYSIALRLLGLALREEGRYDEAEPALRQALALDEHRLGPEHPNTLGSVSNLASLLESKGDYAGAEPLYRRALEASERVLGPEHPNTLSSVNNLAGLLARKGDYAGAEPLHRRVLEASERVLGPEHPATLTSVNNLAFLLERKGDYAGAEPLYRRALEARERVSRPEHPDTLISVNNLAGLLESKSDYAGAEPLYRRALEARERVLGPEHPATLGSVNNLAFLLERKGDYAGAEPLYRRALEASERVLGPEHPNTLQSVNNLAGLLESKGDYAGAEPLYRRALEASERVLGPEHPDTLISVNNLAFLLERKGDYAGAEPLYRRALEGLLRISATIGRPHPNLEVFIGNYARCLEKQGRSREDIQKTLEAMRRPFGMSLGDGGGRQRTGVEPSPKLRPVIEQLRRDPSKTQEIAEKLKREDFKLFMEFAQWIQSQ